MSPLQTWAALLVGAAVVLIFAFLFIEWVEDELADLADEDTPKPRQCVVVRFPARRGGW